MRKKPAEQPSKADEQKALEERVKKIMGGPSDQDPKDSKDDEDNPPERILVIPPSTDKSESDTLPGTPDVTDMPEDAGQPTDTKTTDDSRDTGDDPATEKAVDDIVSKEGDEALAAEDAEVQKAFQEPKHRSFKQKVVEALQAWWHNKKARYTTFAVLGVMVIALSIVPATRYFMLNLVGIRSSASLTVVDDSTQLPLKNVQVSLGGKSGLTNGEGQVHLTRIKLGRSQLVIKKRAFAEKTTPVTVGWGSNPLGNVAITATGARYTFVLKDFLSGEPVQKAEAISGEANAVSDKDGKIILTVDTSEDPTLTVTIKASDYRDEQVTFDADSKEDRALNMVPGRKSVFVSKRSGKYDVYKVDVDGKNEELLLAGTGNERDDIALVSHPTDEVVALVSTRDNDRNKDGYLLSTLTLVKLGDGSNTKLAQSEQIQIVGWAKDRLVYVQIAAGASASNPKRFRLISYDYKTADKQELASANYFNDVMMVGDSAYVAPSGSYQPDANVGLFKIPADGRNKKTILNQEVWNIFRVEYDKFYLSTQNAWYEHKLGDSSATKLAASPANAKNRLYVDNPEAKHSLWVDQRDGKGVLIDYSTDAKEDKTLLSQSGINNPLRWLTNNTLIYRIQTTDETADYVLNIDGGEARKIKDVSPTTGLGLWYYY